MRYLLGRLWFRRVIVRGTALAILAVLTASCGGGATREAAASRYTEATVAARGPFGVGVTTLDLFDPSRNTEPNGDVPGSPGRRLQVEVWYPAAASAASPEERDAPLDRGGAPYPLIIFAHGFSSFRRQSASFTQHLASHGYVVAAPDFPSSNLETPGGPRLDAVLDQPGDVSFVIDNLLGMSNVAGGRFSGAIDSNAIGVSGHSLGGLTTMLTVYGPFRDPRVRAALAISPPGCFLTHDVAGDTSVPLMVMGGSRDLIVNPASIRAAYEMANPPRYLVLLTGADHVRFADIDLEDAQVAGQLESAVRGPLADEPQAIASGIGGSLAACAEQDSPGTEPLMAPDRQRLLLREFGLTFFDAYLRGDAEARRFLDALPGLVSEAHVDADAAQ